MSAAEDLRSQLLTLLREKKLLYDQMIAGNREFDEVKNLFMEIKALKQQLLNSEKEAPLSNFSSQ